MSSTEYVNMRCNPFWKEMFPEFMMGTYEFRKVCGLSLFRGPDTDFEYHDNLIKEEYHKEYLPAKTSDEKADALADSIVVVVSRFIDCGDLTHVESWVPKIVDLADIDRINLMGAFRLVCESNLSKVSTDLELIERDADGYRAQGISVEVRETEPGLYGIFCLHDPVHGQPKGKILKPSCYFKPDWGPHNQHLYLYE